MFASHSSSGGTSASSNCAHVRLLLLSGTRSIVHFLFKRDNAFYHVRKGNCRFDRSVPSRLAPVRVSRRLASTSRAAALPESGQARTLGPLVGAGKMDL